MEINNCGLICKCKDDFRPTPAHPGEKPALRKIVSMKEVPVPGTNRTRFIFVEEWIRVSGASCDAAAASCSQFGKDWKMVGAYHSHPTNSDWSKDSDDAWLNLGYGFAKGTPDGKIELLTEGGKIITLQEANSK